MELTNYELINHEVDPSSIQQDYYGHDKIYYSLERTSDGEAVCFYNPEFAFEKQHLENADATKILSYLKITEKYPQAYEKYLQKGFLYIRMDAAFLSSFVMHIFK
jgi:hypothetical protein